MDVDEFTDRVLCAMQLECCNRLLFRTDGEFAPITFWVMCDCVFAGATLDLEQVTPFNVDVLERSIQDAKAGGGWAWGPDLFVSRMRRKKPVCDILEMMGKQVRDLFDRAAEQPGVEHEQRY